MWSIQLNAICYREVKAILTLSQRICRGTQQFDVCCVAANLSRWSGGEDLRSRSTSVRVPHLYAHDSAVAITTTSSSSRLSLQLSFILELSFLRALLHLLSILHHGERSLLQAVARRTPQPRQEGEPRHSGFVAEALLITPGACIDGRRWWYRM